MDSTDKNTLENPTITKIEIDETTAEPSIVELKADEVHDEKSFMELTEDLENKDGQEESEKQPKKHSAGKQLVMTNVLGMSDKAISKRQKVFKITFTVIFIVFVIGVLAWTAYNDFFNNPEPLPSFADVADIFSKTWFYLILAFVALGGCFLFKGLKLTIMCKSMTGKAHFKTCMETSVLGLYYNNATPLAVGGQPFEIYHLSKRGVDGGVAASIPIATFFLNQFAFVILGILSLALFFLNTFAAEIGISANVFSVMAIVGLCTCFLGPFAVVLFSMMPKVGSTLVHFIMWLGEKLHIVKNPKLTAFKTMRTVLHNAKCLKRISTNAPVFASTFLLSFCEWFAQCSIAYFVLRFFGFELAANGFIEWLEIIQISLILYAAVSFIPTPGNAGAADLSFYLVFSEGLKTAGLAFPAMIVWRLLSYYSYLIIGFIFNAFKKRADHKRLSTTNE